MATSKGPWDLSGSSIFSADIRFVGVGKQKKSFSQLGSENIERKTKATGKHPGTIKGISRKERRG